MVAYEQNHDLWWPSGYGEQPLYDLEISFSSLNITEVLSKNTRIGFRTVELDESFVDADNPDAG